MVRNVAAPARSSLVKELLRASSLKYLPTRLPATARFTAVSASESLLHGLVPLDVIILVVLASSFSPGTTRAQLRLHACACLSYELVCGDSITRPAVYMHVVSGGLACTWRGLKKRLGSVLGRREVGPH
jgi:hypothetical protein